MAKQESRSAVAQVRLVRQSERLTPRERRRQRALNSAAGATTGALLTAVPAVALGAKSRTVAALSGTSAVLGGGAGTFKPVPRTRRSYSFEVAKRDPFNIEKYNPQPVQQALGHPNAAQKAANAARATRTGFRRVKGGLSSMANPRVQGLPQGEVTNRYSRAFL
jgi:hypothetical protein